MEALYWHASNGKIRCTLCPHLCLVPEGETGLCKVRRNVNGKLQTEAWGKISAMHSDPIEKKPLYHFHPGRSILSIGSVGCNMQCKCCQNWQISQVSPLEYKFDHDPTPSDILKIAVSDKKNIGIAYTYNEPVIWYEFMMAIARLVHEKGLKNVMVSNGFISEQPLLELLPYIDALNIDLKGFNENFYRSFTGASLGDVLRTLKLIRKAGRHLEITNLIIPSQNDEPSEFTHMVKWIANELGNDTVLHISQYHPAYKLGIEPTSASDLEKLLDIARKFLFHVYAGNIQVKDYMDTKCNQCGKIIITRAGYNINKTSVSEEGMCMNCGNQVIIY